MTSFITLKGKLTVDASSWLMDQDGLKQITAYFGRRLRQARLTANLTQDVLSARSQVGQDMISRYEKGHSLPSLPTLCRLAHELGVPITYFFPDEQTGALSDEQRDALHLLDTLSPLALDYVVIFVRHVAIMQHQRRFLESEAFGEDSDQQARLTRLMARDLRELEDKLARQPGSSPHASVQTLVAFTALAILGMELQVDTSATTRTARRVTRQLREVQEA
jgi:transcriptional regulator with XRE-family HTH domain